MAHVGSMPCPLSACGKDAAVSVSTTGNRSVRCPHCGFSGYGGAGSKAGRLIDAATRKDDDDAPAGTPPAATPPAAAPAPAKRAGLLIG